ncbi:MAG: hypothetical protein Pars2KO_33150 [Parasphingorhabdus sp.]
MRRALPLTIAVLLWGVFAATTNVHSSMALDDWNMDARNALPTYIKIWLASMLVAHLSSVFFVRKHRPARWVLGGFLLSHLWVAYAEYSDAIDLKAGLVSFGHIVFWLPAIISFYRNRADIKLSSAYGIWACIMFFYYAVSLTIDVREATIYFRHVTG